MIRLEGGPLDGYEADAEDGPLVGIPHSDLEIRVPDPKQPDLTVTHYYFITSDPGVATYVSTSAFGSMDAGMLTTVRKPVLRPPSG